MKETISIHGDNPRWNETHFAALQKVASALCMTADEFLADDACSPTALQARDYLHTFAVQAEESQVLAAYYLIRAITRRKDVALLHD